MSEIMWELRPNEFITEISWYRTFSGGENPLFFPTLHITFVRATLNPYGFLYSATKKRAQHLLHAVITR